MVPAHFKLVQVDLAVLVLIQQLKYILAHFAGDWIGLPIVGEETIQKWIEFLAI